MAESGLFASQRAGREADITAVAIHEPLPT
jgi:hypothetical protein